MNKHQNFFQRLNIKLLALPALLGAFGPFALILFFILTKEEVLESWMLIPLTIIPLGGAIAGVFFYLMGFVWFPFGKQKLIAIILSIILYFIAVWMSAVIAFNFSGDWD